MPLVLRGRVVQMQIKRGHEAAAAERKARRSFVHEFPPFAPLGLGLTETTRNIPTSM